MAPLPPTYLRAGRDHAHCFATKRAVFGPRLPTRFLATFVTTILYPLTLFAAPNPPDTREEGALTNWDDADGTVFGGARNLVALPSGEGTPGGDAVFYIGNQPGDVDDSGKTVLADIGLIRGAANPFLSVPISNAFDVDKSGKVLLADVGEARLDANPFFQLPAISP